MSSTQRCYYQVLELEKTCSIEEVKKGYRKLAVKWHPDKNPDNKEEALQRFKEINEAYEVLSDVDKRRDYDKYGREGPSTKPFKHGRAEDIFKHFYEDFGFGNEENDFFSRFFGKRAGGGIGGRGFPFSGFGGMGGLSNFSDPFFSGGFSAFSSFDSGSIGGNRAPGKTIQKKTSIINGQSVTTTKTIITNADGSQEVTETSNLGGKPIEKKYSIQSSGSDFMQRPTLKVRSSMFE